MGEGEEKSEEKQTNHGNNYLNALITVGYFALEGNVN